MEGSSDLYQSCSRVASTPGESEVPSVRCRSASRASPSGLVSHVRVQREQQTYLVHTSCLPRGEVQGRQQDIRHFSMTIWTSMVSAVPDIVDQVLPNHLSYKALPRRLFRRERSQKTQQSRLVGDVWLEFRLVVDLHQEYAQVSATTTLTCLEQHRSTRSEEVGGRGIIVGLDIARSDNTQLLVSFVELAFLDSGLCQSCTRRLRPWTYFCCCRAIVFWILDDMFAWETG